MQKKKKKKKLARFARKFAIANFSRMARRIIENCGILVKFDGLVVQDGAFELFLHCMLPPLPPPPQDRRLCLKTLNKSSSNLYVSELL